MSQQFSGCCHSGSLRRAAKNLHDRELLESQNRHRLKALLLPGRSAGAGRFRQPLYLHHVDTGRTISPSPVPPARAPGRRAYGRCLACGLYGVLGARFPRYSPCRACGGVHRYSVVFTRRSPVGVPLHKGVEDLLRPDGLDGGAELRVRAGVVGGRPREVRGARDSTGHTGQPSVLVAVIGCPVLGGTGRRLPRVACPDSRRTPRATWSSGRLRCTSSPCRPRRATCSAGRWLPPDAAG